MRAFGYFNRLSNRRLVERLGDPTCPQLGFAFGCGVPCIPSETEVGFHTRVSSSEDSRLTIKLTLWASPLPTSCGGAFLLRQTVDSDRSRRDVFDESHLIPKFKLDRVHHMGGQRSATRERVHRRKLSA